MNGVQAERSVAVELGERSYRISIRPGIMRDIGSVLRTLPCGKRIGIVTDRNVARRYLRVVTRSLVEAGFDPTAVVLPPGERTKTLHTVVKILNEWIRHRFERQSTVLALGGGVVGDLTGFAASIYLRGVSFVQIPTTLVAQVDSSVGGKTGVDHPRGKNLVGAFHQPRAVLIDPTTLQTLPHREWVAGLAEVIKYGVIADDEFFTFLEHSIDQIHMFDDESVSHVITRSCEIKAAVVSEDERESGRRRILNFGHTIGHALEALGGYRGLVHGEAVAIGMVQEADLAGSLGYCSHEVVNRIRGLVRASGLPDELPKITFNTLWDAMQSDKKVAQGTVYCIVPQRIGEVTIAPLERDATAKWFHAATARKVRRASTIPRRRRNGA
ncbi:MAG: 3-dehydroquinate synthase [Nitrospiraceae bacterium]